MQLILYAVFKDVWIQALRFFCYSNLSNHLYIFVRDANLENKSIKSYFRRKMRFATCLVLSWMISWRMTAILCPPVIQCFPLQLLQHCHHHLHHSTHLQTMKTSHQNPLIISLCDKPQCEEHLFVIDMIFVWSADQQYGPKSKTTDDLLKLSTTIFCILFSKSFSLRWKWPWKYCLWWICWQNYNSTLTK